ncbi:TRAP transporter large permease subunit [Exilibacterium tricleocarpae]|uniref:TRAP transporter large permease protein n=1 Tax=Exilibacterium tricleocarpae TaxID=2591008 RepID=A0A545TZG2_9GAMM|nr:TRAP transporter large permease subunit [Exilibacterium tricleocarpae]TQV82610.1 TRAP transporter large permease subunit [Exilibacterium tricleocarpae]
MLTLAIIFLILLALIGTPLFIIIAAASLFGLWWQEIHLSVMAVEIYRITDTPMLVALPLFTLAGYLIAESRSPDRLVALTRALLGWMPAGLPIIALITCTFFTAITGASGVTIVAIGALLYPALKKAGYPGRFSLGMVTASGSLGLLLVPSMPLILYGILVQQMNIGPAFELKQLFIAGVLPLLLMVLLLALWVLWATRKEPVERQPFRWAEARRALWLAKWELPLPLIVIGGIYGGWFAISEVAAIAALYTLIVQVFLYREIALRSVPAIMIKASVIIGEIIVILAVSLALTNVLIDAEVPALVFETIRETITSKYVFLFFLTLLLLALGAILDIFSATVVMVPLILPVALSYGIHPIHLGIIFLSNMQIGYFTPPIGMNLFIASSRFKRPITEIYSATLPFFFVLLLAVLIITYVPALSLALIDH